MMPPRPNQGSGDMDPERIFLGGIAVFLAVAVMALLLWWKCHTQIALLVFWIQGAELRLIGLFTDQFRPVLVGLRHANPAHQTPQTLWRLSTLTGQILRWPALIIIALLAALCLLRAPRERYQERFGFTGMQKALAKLHPIGAAWAGVPVELTLPSSPPLPLKPMDPALSVTEWMARFAPAPDRKVQIRQIDDALRTQLGGRWGGPQNALVIEKCVFMVCALQMERKKDDALDLLGRLSQALAPGMKKGEPSTPLVIPKPFERHLSRVWKKHSWDKAIALTSPHGWSRPALLTLLQEARLRSGVFNPGLFSMIQLVDRSLWLTLSASAYPRYGMPRHLMSVAPCLEAAAAIEHWQAECGVGRPLETPAIQRTLSTLLDLTSETD